MNEETLLKQGVTAARAGRRDEAWRLLAQVLHQNQRNELAWLWLSGVVDSKEQRVKCLENVLMLNPDNSAAREGLARLQARAGIPSAMPQPDTPSPAAQCPHCGASNRATAKFCCGCGQRLGYAKPPLQAQTVRCPGCGFDNPVNFRFCSKCGQGLGAAGPPSPLPASASQSARPRLRQPQPRRVPAQAIPVPTSAAPLAAPPMPKPARSAPRPVSPASVPQPVAARPAVVRQRSMSDSIFCVACGVENRDDVSSCAQCGDPITMPSPAEVQRLIAVVKNSSSKEERLQAMRTLGHLKARAAIPLLLEIANIKGFKRHREQWVAKFALTQVIDISMSVVTCEACEAINPSDARFCHNCGVLTSRPTATVQEIEQLIELVRNSSSRMPLQAVRKLGQIRASDAVPDLVDLFKRLNKGLLDKMELLLVLEALAEIGDPVAVPQASGLARQYSLAPLPIPVCCVQVLVKLNRYDLAMQHLRQLARPDGEDLTGRNLIYVLLVGQIGEADAVSFLCSNIMEEKKRWEDIGIGYAIRFSDPISVLITATLSIAYNVLGRALIVSQAQSASALMVVRESLDSTELDKMPGQVRMMVALHCYSTALATIVSRNPVPIKAEWSKRKKPWEQAVISLAMAQSGDPSVESVLDALRSNSDWPVRLLAYEGLIVLADVTGKAPGAKQLAALRDKDTRVRIAVARVMASTGDVAYVPHILALADSSGTKQRRAVLPVIEVLAYTGHQPAVAKLQGLAQRDSDGKVRESARAILQNMRNSNPP